MKQEDFFRQNISASDLIEIQDKLEEAHKDDTPFPVVTRDGINVVGDPNKTEVKSHDYSIRFRFPKNWDRVKNLPPEEIIKEVGGFVIVKFDFENVTIKPRYDLEITAAISRIYPYLYKVTAEGGFEKRTPEDLTDILDAMCQTIGDDLYHAAAVILGVDKELEEYMMWNDVVGFVSTMVTDFPEIFNETEGFIE